MDKSLRFLKHLISHRWWNFQVSWLLKIADGFPWPRFPVPVEREAAARRGRPGLAPFSKHNGTTVWPFATNLQSCSEGETCWVISPYMSVYMYKITHFTSDYIMHIKNVICRYTVSTISTVSKWQKDAAYAYSIRSECEVNFHMQTYLQHSTPKTFSS